MLKLKWLLQLVNVEVLVYIGIRVHIFSFSKAPEIETQFLQDKHCPLSYRMIWNSAWMSGLVRLLLFHLS